MAVADKPSARQAKRLQTRERLMGAAVAEFKRAGMAAADIGTIVSAAGVAHGTFFFHFPTKEHVLLELERREEERISAQFIRYVNSVSDLGAKLTEAIRLVRGLEQRLGAILFKDFLALHFSPTRPAAEGAQDHSMVVLIAREIERAQALGEADAQADAMNSAVFFLLGLYALLVTTHDWPTQGEMLEDYVCRTLRGLGVCQWAGLGPAADGTAIRPCRPAQR
ncbi:TetR/AcrR family transcriptional regulator [Mycolicibacterium peregrinum]|uniref:TetR/AcrR family transcriptional regulator n=1 Tax=Mycolicibacterium peregrinum TaxID=43304 RepID=A0A4Z0HVM3_MYCPR|nr:TetR/AcrR family transcriptional regulator [Mycolicibacterium peregrinum]TGB43074.1 TetR/AcrR family transcriptional regulator [Mycolicibacterium peregrinum]TGB44155.1 TetR/AcrR family transcriptional regulator [Mycolicibacterium peregrinum]